MIDTELKQYAVTGIGTDVGKTVVSAILCEALSSCYWKPVQAGDLDNSDSVKIKKYCSDNVTVLEERFRLTEPMSPHAAAAIDGVEINVEDFTIPPVKDNLIVEGAGGVLVPFNDKAETYLDIFWKLNLPIILVSRHYLGSINHTMLTIESLQNKGLHIYGIVYVGAENKTTEDIIDTKYMLPVLGRIPIAEEITPAFIQEQAAIIKDNL